MTIAAAVSANTQNRVRLQKRIGELDAALLAHHKEAAAQQTKWRETEADLLRQRNQALKELSEL